MLEDLSPETLAMMQDMLLAMDPPRHVGYRRNVAPQFVPRVINSLEPRVRSICRQIMRVYGVREAEMTNFTPSEE